jgi:hypothetical protein
MVSKMSVMGGKSQEVLDFLAELLK